MKYVALLRGINVGGNSLIKMADLKEAVAKCGFTNVATYINSGNVIFESDKNDIEKFSKTLEENLSKTFKFAIRLIVISQTQLKNILSSIPNDWKQDDLRKYIAFIKEPLTPHEVISEMQLKEGIDFVKAGPGVVYMSTLLSGLTKSGFTKLVGKKVYKNITIRNYNTTQKLLTLMVK